MSERHNADTSRGGPIVATRNTIAGCGQVLEENRWSAWLRVDRENEEEGEEEKKKERNNNVTHRREWIADSRTERPPRGFLSRDRE